MKNTSLPTRKNFLKMGLITALVAPFLKKISTKENEKPAEKTEKVKMLTQEGILVEIDRKHISNPTSEKISDSELLQWIKNQV